MHLPPRPPRHTIRPTATVAGAVADDLAPTKPPIQGQNFFKFTLDPVFWLQGANSSLRSRSELGWARCKWGRWICRSWLQGANSWRVMREERVMNLWRSKFASQIHWNGSTFCRNASAFFDGSHQKWQLLHSFWRNCQNNSPPVKNLPTLFDWSGQIAVNLVKIFFEICAQNLSVKIAYYPSNFLSYILMAQTQVKKIRQNFSLMMLKIKH